MLKQAVVLLALVGVACAAVTRVPLEPIPKEFEGVKGCYISELDIMIPVGERRPSQSSCQEYVCGETMVQILECGTVAVKSPCRAVYDNTKLYPDCCTPTVECDEQR